MEGFPITESFTDCCGEVRQFEVSLHTAETGYFLRAAEIRDEREGYQFAAYAESSPYLALARLRQRIAQGLASRYLIAEEGHRHLGHDRAVGHIGYGCVVIDGEEIAFTELGRMLQSYEGWQFEIRLVDPYHSL